jgi:diketogulonate reductase-like aldo/keto reductase
MINRSTTRREALAMLSALGMAGAGSAALSAQEQMPRRLIPGTGESLPVIGLGSSKPVSQIAAKGPEPLAAVLRALVDNGGSVVDTWPRNAANDAALGRVINEPGLRDALFIASKIDQIGKEAGERQYHETKRRYQRETIDLMQIFSLTDLDTQWLNLREWQASGGVRYVGVTVADANLYGRLENFVRREKPDFVQVNYSITERTAEERMLPLCRDLGVAVIINRPFMNGEYFRRLGQRPLPEWAADFDCESWAQFSLKYILPHPAITCVLTETSSAAHMAENARAAFGRMPGAAERDRMKLVLEQE